jgi:hypothetical protein
MPRQRIRARLPSLAVGGHIVAVVLLLAIAYYGIVLGLVGLGAISPGIGDAISGYRTVFDAVAGATPEDADGVARIVAGVGGLLAFLLFAFLAFKQIPRPQLARSEVELERDDRGVVTLSPRAVERAVESAALGNPAVSSVRGRYGTEDVAVDLTVTRARDLEQTLHDVHRRARRALEVHDVPSVPVNVTVMKFGGEAQRRVT